MFWLTFGDKVRDAGVEFGDGGWEDGTVVG